MTGVPAGLAGALQDRFRLERELGRGGMATVYLAEDLKHRRAVAIKVLRPELAAAVGAERFLREIGITARLDHPHILPLLDSGQAGEALYYVMPFVEGESLRDRLARDRQLPLEDALRIVREVADALAHAHSRGIVHRDIKPDNILLAGGHARVADFGIARAIDAAGGEKLTETGLAVGTVAYMSPEQSVGDAELDGRSDVYSLGCVLYEMLGGEPPFTGPTAQAIIAKRMLQPVPSLRVLREGVPASIEAAVTRSLARSPADRFATAGTFAEALEPTEVGATGKMIAAPRARTVPPARWSVALAVLAVAILGVMRARRPAAPVLDADLIAVAPFDAVDPSLDVWREGVVDLLSRTLDGAGSLRTVSPSVVVRGWRGRSDRASATALARRTGAGLAVIGSLSRLGADSSRIRASLLDVGRGAVVGEMEVAGGTSRMGVLVDSLGLEILRALSRERPVGAVRQAAIGSAPLPALKAFLRGEQFYRQGLYDSSLAAYSAAIASDSSFTIAYYRMALVQSWTPATGGSYPDAASYSAQAHARNHGLGARDSLLIDAQHLEELTDAKRPASLNAVIRATEEIARRFPRDPEAWYRVGEARYHGAWNAGNEATAHRALEAFDRAIALDSGYYPAYEHLLQAALNSGQLDRAVRYAKAGIRLQSNDQHSLQVRLASALLLAPAGAADSGVARQLDSADATWLYRVGMEALVWWPDSHETALSVLRRLSARQVLEGESTPFIVDSLMRRRYVAMALMSRGRLREAMAADSALIANPEASAYSFWGDPFLHLALFGVVPTEVAAKTFGLSLGGFDAARGNPSDYRRALEGLPWWAMQRDTAALAQFGRRMGEAATRAEQPEARVKARYLQTASAGYLALVRGDTAKALSHFAELSDTACAVLHCFPQRLTQASLLAARGEDRSAAAILDRSAPLYPDPLALLANLERARIAERLKDRRTAMRLYQFVVDAWRQADPELQRYVAEAREGLARHASESH